MRLLNLNYKDVSF